MFTVYLTWSTAYHKYTTKVCPILEVRTGLLYFMEYRWTSLYARDRDQKLGSHIMNLHIKRPRVKVCYKKLSTAWPCNMRSFYLRFCIQGVFYFGFFDMPIIWSFFWQKLSSWTFFISILRSYFVKKISDYSAITYFLMLC